MGDTLRMGVIGCGWIGGVHAEALAALPEVRLVGACDIDGSRAQALADRHGIPRVDIDGTALVRSGAVDAVTVCTPHKAHADLVCAAAEAGVHVIVEKPISTSLAEADRMIAATRAAGVTFGAIFQRRFFPAAQRMKAAIDAGRLGRLTSAQCFAHLSRDRAYFDSADWRGTWESEGGGALMNQAIHMVDMLQWLMGQPVEVYGRWATLRHGDYIDVEDTAVATVEFAGGALAVIHAVTTLDPQFGFRLAVHGTSGDTVGLRELPELTQAVTDVWTFAGEEPVRAAWERAERGRPGLPEFHGIQLRDFVRAVLEGRPPAVTGEEARTSLEIIQAVYRSQRTRQPVSLPVPVGEAA
jgi:UDP-N-acetyl-2-amino-2-deoxyglucuronate dehydrogenase